MYEIITFAGDSVPRRRRFSAAVTKGDLVIGPCFFTVDSSVASATEVPLDALFSPESCGVLGKLDIMLESG